MYFMLFTFTRHNKYTILFLLKILKTSGWYLKLLVSMYMIILRLTFATNATVYPLPYYVQWLNFDSGIWDHMWVTRGLAYHKDICLLLRHQGGYSQRLGIPSLLA